MNTRQQILIWTAGVVLFFLTLYWLRAILLPFIVGAALAYFLDPAADKLETLRIPRSAATAILLILFFAFFVGIALLLVPLIQDQVGTIADRLPEYVARFTDLIKSMGDGRLAELLGVDPAGLQRTFESIAQQGAGVVTKLLGNLLTGGVAFVGVLSIVLITPVVAFFLLRDWDVIVAEVDEWLPRQHAEVIREQFRRIDRVLAGFVRGQALDCVAQGILYAIGWTAVGLDFAIVLGLLNGLLNFIPYVGTTFGFLLAMLVALGQFGPDLTPLLLVAVVHVAVQTTDQAFLTPKLIGPRVGLHPVWILFALLAGGSLLGFLGVLVAVPIAAAVGVLTRFGIHQYKESQLFLGPSGFSKGGGEPP
jgi:predicted PurR-regulated permease PerM